MTWVEFLQQRLQYIITLVLVYLAAFFLYIVVANVDFGPGFSDWVAPEHIFAGLIIVYTLASFRTVRRNDNALILRFGRPIMQVSSGLVFVPLWICTLEAVQKTVIEMQLPGEDRQVWRLKDGSEHELPLGIREDGTRVDPPPGGWVRPIRIATGSRETTKLGKQNFPPPTWDPSDPDKARKQAQYDAAKIEFDAEETKFESDANALEKAQDPMHERLTLEPVFIVRFRVADLVRFVQVIGSIEEARRQIEDTVVSRAQREMGRRTPALIIAHQDDIDRRIHRDVEILIGEKEDPRTGVRREPWGITLSDAYMAIPGVTETVNKASAKAVAAGFEAVELAKRGGGQGKEIENREAGKTRAIEARGKVMNKKGARRAAELDATVQAVGNNTKIVATGGSDLEGSLTKLMTTLNETTKP